MIKQNQIHTKSRQIVSLLISSFVQCLDQLLPATTLQDVQFKLAKEDAEATEASLCSPHKVSLTEFLTKGLELEEQQYVSSLFIHHL